MSHACFHVKVFSVQANSRQREALIQNDSCFFFQNDKHTCALVYFKIKIIAKIQ